MCIYSQSLYANFQPYNDRSFLLPNFVALSYHIYCVVSYFYSWKKKKTAKIWQCKLHT